MKWRGLKLNYGTEDPGWPNTPAKVCLPIGMIRGAPKGGKDPSTCPLAGYIGKIRCLHTDKPRSWDSFRHLKCEYALLYLVKYRVITNLYRGQTSTNKTNKVIRHGFLLACKSFLLCISTPFKRFCKYFLGEKKKRHLVVNLRQIL